MGKGMASIIIAERRQWAKKLEERRATAKRLKREIRQLKERITELEDGPDLPISDCMRAKLKPVTAESFASSMHKAREAQERAASASFSPEAFSQHMRRLFEEKAPVLLWKDSNE